MGPDPTRLLNKIGLTTPLIGFYDAPDPSPFAPLVRPGMGRGRCVFGFYQQWLGGKTLHITREEYGCRGAGHWLCDITVRSLDEFV